MSRALPQTTLAAEVSASAEEHFAIPFSELSLDDLPRVGGKNASLGELMQNTRALGIRVPDGFAVTVQAFQLHLQRAGLSESIFRDLESLDIRDTKALAQTAGSIRQRIMAAPLPSTVVQAITKAYEDLSRDSDGECAVAVRSSATAEDLPSASFAGQQETYLNVRGESALIAAVRACMASLFTDRAIVYREEHQISHRGVGLSVGVQQMVRSDIGCAGVMFTLDTESGFRDVVVINGSWGLGETVVQGRVSPDEFWVHKPTALAGYPSIIRRDLGEKRVKLVYAEGMTRSVKEVRVPLDQRRRFVLDNEEILQLARWAIAIEQHYSQKSGRPTPMDLEWARDGVSGQLFILQARPETVHSQASASTMDLFKLRGTGKILVRGKSVGNRIGIGSVRVVQDSSELADFQSGEVLVAAMTDPDWEPILQKAAAVVTDHGGRTCHAAIVSREIGIPCVVGTGNASTDLRNGQLVTVSCAEGDEGRVYEGRIDYTREQLNLAEIPQTTVPLMLNLANPERAFHLAALPATGVGLLRIEFLISNWIGIHPMALCRPELVAKLETRREVLRRTRGWANPSEFFVDQLALGIGQITAAFYPRPVIVRFSDFKTNEYAGLLGGESFEPAEANPMIGFRGASRYYDERYRQAFALECQAIQKVRHEMGLVNLKVMIPFCRTVQEGQRVLEEMRKNGLVRGQDELEVWVMCEIPNNVILADEFSKWFDGFSIGSNDLTQLTLGVDRDSELLSHIFDERDDGVKRMIQMVVTSAHRCARRVGICGEAPSNYPEMAQWLAEIGIDSISLNPDSFPTVARRLSAIKPG
jgi:pyruvate,water dikinase